MHQQSALLIAHTQIERLKLQNCKKLPERPLSYHGEDLLYKLTNPKLNVYLPFKLHGSRIEQQKKSQLNVSRELIETDSIESDFFKFFDCAKCMFSIFVSNNTIFLFF